MKREEYLLAAMSETRGRSLTPVQVQKYFFLLDAEISELTGGPYFDFKPHGFGPFDINVYRELNSLSENNMVEIFRSGWGRTKQYRMSQDGLVTGINSFAEFPENAQIYIRALVEWILPLSFTQVVSEIYRKYPEMKVNGLFQHSQ